MAKSYGAARVSIAGGALLAMLAGVDYLQAETGRELEGGQAVVVESAPGATMPGASVPATVVEPAAPTTAAAPPTARPRATPTTAARTSRGS